MQTETNTIREGDLILDADSGEVLENLAEAEAGEDQYEPDTVYLPKMTIRACEGAPERAVIPDKDNPMGRRVTVLELITGQVTEYRVTKGKNDDGTESEFYALIGRFKAENYAGDTFRSGVCYLPAGLHEIVLERLAVVKQNAARFGDVRGVEFAFKIDAIPAPNSFNPSAYAYRAKSRTAISKADPLEGLWNRAKRVASLRAPAERRLIEAKS